MLDMPTNAPQNGLPKFIQETTPNKSSKISRWCYICSDCGASYSYCNSAMVHISGNHKGNSASIIVQDVSENPSTNRTCQVCDATFSSNGNLRKHLLQHNGVLYKCSCCDNSSRYAATIYKHIKNNHKDQKATVIKISGSASKSLGLSTGSQVKPLDLPMPKNNKTIQEVATKRKHENDYENTELDSKKSKFTVTEEEIDAANILCGMRHGIDQTKTFP